MSICSLPERLVVFFIFNSKVPFDISLCLNRVVDNVIITLFCSHCIH